MARQFSDAVSRVRQLRKQVHDIQDTLGAKDSNKSATTTNATTSTTTTARPQNAAAMSLRELWLKKLECEATLALLDRLDVIRAAPSQFDHLVQPPLCRIGAAVLTLTRALQTMFSDDIAQVQALHKIMEQLMLRKQKAEEIVWYVEWKVAGVAFVIFFFFADALICYFWLACQGHHLRCCLFAHGKWHPAAEGSPFLSSLCRPRLGSEHLLRIASQYQSFDDASSRHGRRIRREFFGQCHGYYQSV